MSEIKIELNSNEVMAVLEQLSALPYHEVQGLILVLTKKLIAATEAEDSESFRKELLGEQ